ncbi:cyclic peptide export ABC transporter [Xanthomonas euroxanthea]|uniref:Cyclic peptide export ABC transporter n=1 Tax=Xanthomonas euroxanthea TaxID=2259622 RepID=A0A8E4G700_9XANT|nr:cyclic peptide export ABC transporter [Xanthomonas euroxanthea]CAD1792178.1 cyclic peptide export ABC transporter [Xanthomonas euroxanthea]SYZ55755.1 cyclic peptide export ABC transporter [Xanthomonas arboricola pv. juglandis]
MNLLTEFSRSAPNKAYIGIVMGGLAGICYAFLIPLVSLALAGDGAGSSEHTYEFLSFEILEPGFAALFFALCAVIFISRFLSRMTLLWVSIDLTANLRIRMCRLVLRAPVTELESIGPSRLTVVLTEDVNRIVNGAEVLPGLLTGVVSLVGLFGFLLYLNPPVFRLVMMTIVFGIITYQVPMYFGMRMFERARNVYDDLQESLRGVIHGARDLKSDDVKRANYFSRVLERRQSALARTNKRAYAICVGAETYGDMLSLLVIGVVAFVIANYYALAREDVISIVMVLLYVSGPIGAILAALPQIVMARTSLNNVNRLFAQMNAEPEPATRPAILPWNTLQLSAVEFGHRRSAQHDGFLIGPLDIVIRRGEITFIVGGNGSGKSTLAKLVSMHYGPSSGSISTDSQLLTEDLRAAFRQEITAIFSDYYLFDRLLGPEGSASDEEAVGHLARLGLTDKVAVVDGVFSTLRLSDGQRRRIALMVALIDDKPLVVFDEWAADQDPTFKNVFYHEVLPELKARGKAVVVISHDDRYFDAADQQITMEQGKIRDVWQRSHTQGTPSLRRVEDARTAIGDPTC